MPEGLRVELAEGAGLLESLQQVAGGDFESPCGGQGKCGKCKVMVRSGESWVEALACRTRVDQDMTVLLPARPSGKEQILQQGSASVTHYALDPAVRKVVINTANKNREGSRQRARWDWLLAGAGVKDRAVCCDAGPVRQLAELLQSGTENITAVIIDDAVAALEEGDTAKTLFGMAFDIGTTTIVGYLLNLTTGVRVATVSAMNSQRAYGADVITRVGYAISCLDGLGQLQGAVQQCVNELIGQAALAAGICRTDIYELVFVGNTCMHHLFWGIHPAGLGGAPYKPVVWQPVRCLACSLSLAINQAGFACWLPNVSGFIGSDTIGALLANPVDLDAKARLMVDIGTNGEIALGVEGRLWACSTAAGPAFEGACIEHGMRALPGAIDTVRITADGITYSVIGGCEPEGLCGSGLVDAVAGLLINGIIDATGKFQSDEDFKSLPVIFKERVINWEESRAFVIAPRTNGRGPVVVTQKDIRQVQLAKGAIAAGIMTIVKEAGLRLEEISAIYVAGAFGNYLDKNSVCAIGLLPPELKNVIVPVGNAAGEGAVHSLLSASIHRSALDIAKRVNYVELAGRPDFQDIFMEAMMFSDIGQ